MLAASVVDSREKTRDLGDHYKPMMFPGKKRTLTFPEVKQSSQTHDYPGFSDLGESQGVYTL